MDRKKIPLVAVVGPTASGKTAFSVILAEKYGGEVVSADSMQIYKGMNIATAKPTYEEMRDIPHHLIGAIDINADFSVADYVKLAHLTISDIDSRGKLPILCGGTGLYINSLVDNVKFDEAIGDSAVRERITNEAEILGGEVMLEKLRYVDRETAETLHPNNLTRIIRALEVYEVTGVKLSEHKERSRREESPYELCMIGLTYEDRQHLYDRIDRRVDEMCRQGLVEECFEIYRSMNLKTAHQAIGYKELIPYFKKEASLEECIEKIKLETRHYAKRQLTWFRRDKRINWILLDNAEEAKKIMKKCEITIEKFRKV